MRLIQLRKHRSQIVANNCGSGVRWSKPMFKDGQGFFVVGFGRGELAHRLQMET